MTIDSLLASVVADSMTKRKHNSNRELIGQGLVILQDLLSAACRVPMAMGYGDHLGADGIQIDYNVALHLAWEYLGN